jgi:hypothetical protein
MCGRLMPPAITRRADVRARRPEARFELVAITLGDLSLSNAGVLITVRRSKTDQEGAGRDVDIPRSRSKQNG